MDFTPQQRQMLQTWASQRDALLQDIAKYSVELEGINTGLKEGGLALADLHTQIAEVKGRLAEISALEERMRTSLPNDIAELVARKSRLESECAEKDKELKEKSDRMSVVIVATEELEKAHDTMKDQATIVNSVVGDIIRTSEVAASNMKTIMSEIKTVSDSVIEKSNANISTTNIVLEKMPKFIFDMQKPIPIRRTYPVGHPRYTASESEGTPT